MEFAAVRERVSSNFGSSGSLCQQLLNRNPFKQTSLVVRDPDRTEADAQGIPTFPNPLLHHLVRCGVDPSERHFEYSRPNRIGPVVDVATDTWYANLNTGGHLPTFLINPADRSIPLVQRPNRISTRSEEAGLRADAYRLQHFA